MSYPEIARIFGYKDHTTVMSGVRKARKERMNNQFWANDFSAIESALLDWREEQEIERLEIGA